MAKLAVLASGNGSNFQAIAEAVRTTRHSVVCLITNCAEAYALHRARELSIPSHTVLYAGRSRAETEIEMIRILNHAGADLVALAGFMKVLTPCFIDAFPGRIINIHPSLLPAYPGTDSIERSFRAGDTRMGITIHRVDYGTDTGPILLQKSLERSAADTLENVEQSIHRLEHVYYPEVLIGLLDELEKAGGQE